MQPPGAIAFGDFRLDTASECVSRDGTPIALTPKAYSLLRYFLSHTERLLSKDELLDAIWPDTAVSDAVLKVCVAELRKALADDPSAPRYVATVHRRGYRFIATIATADAPAGAGTAPPRRDGDDARAVGPLVGRAGALAELARAVAAARTGKRQVVFVTGEPGIGKTTLVDAFLAGLDTTVLRTRGQCLEQYGAGEPYLPVLDAFSRLCRDPEHADVLALLRRAAPTWAAAMPWLAADGPPVTPTSRSRMLLELAEALEALTAERPLVVVLEDLHWSDYSTLDLLSLLARRPEPARLLVIGTYRPVEIVVHGHPLRRVKEDLALRRLCREVPLEFFSAADVADYLRLRLGAAALPDRLASLVHARTDGNPLFMVHVVDLLLDRGLLARAADGWTLATDVGADQALLPETLRQMIGHEIATLDADAQQVLAAASAVGVEHATAAVAAALERDVDGVERVLTGLAERRQVVAARAGDVWPDGTRTSRFGFIHALYQSALDQGLAPAERRALHQRVGDRLAAAYGARGADVAAELAVHFTEAGDVPRAVLYLRQAAGRALARHAYQEAIDQLHRALALLATRPADADRARIELDVHMALGPALMAVHGFAAPDVERCYARARGLCREVGVTPELSPALRGLAVFYLTRGDLVSARELAEESLAVAESGGGPGLLAKALVTVGTALYYLGDLDPAHRHLERARRLFARARPKSAHGSVQAPIVNCLAFAAIVSWFRGHPDAALTRAREARGVADELAHPHSVLWAAHVTALLHHFRGEPADAAAAADVAIRVATELGFRQWTAWGVFFRGWLASSDGRLADGIAAMHRGLEEYRATGAELGRIYFSATLAEAYGRAEQVDRAAVLLDECLALATARSERYYAGELHRLRAVFTLREPVAAEAELRRAITLASQQGSRSLALRAATDLAALLRSQGRVPPARQVLAPLYAAFGEGFDTADLTRARAELDALGAPATRARPRVTTTRRRR